MRWRTGRISSCSTVVTGDRTATGSWPRTRTHDRFTQNGLGIVAICVDDVERNRAMVEKLILPFPILSDPEAGVIREWGVYNEPERIAHPAIFVVRSDQHIVLQYIGRDFEDRPANEQVLAAMTAEER